ncbi:MAG TPA: oligosaccharide flippase family protein [Chitinophagaceae bacterium]|jgi:O-antigen/teichoic acid export membrane protein|nr:oligosaccharide flippase family protein [Chitinophagaceae bacterium]
MSFRSVFFTRILQTGGFSYLSQLVQFAASIFTLRLIEPESYGVVGLITVFSLFITVFADSGISLAVIKSEYGATFHRGLANVSLLFGAVLCALMAVLMFPISLFFGQSAIIAPGMALALLFVINSFTIVPQALLRKKMAFARLGQIRLLHALLLSGCTLLLALAGWEVWAIVVPQLLAAAFQSWMTSKAARYRWEWTRAANIRFSFNHTRSLIGNLIGFNVVNYWARNADNLLVGKLYGAHDLGIYSRAYSLLLLPLNSITQVFSQVLFPALVNLKKQGGDIHREYMFTMKVISLLNLPVGFIFIMFPTEFIHLIWGDKWMPVAALLPYFGLLVLTQTITSTLGTVQVLLGKDREMMFGGWICAAFMIAGIVIGAFISMEAIAAFYALFYIVFVIGYLMYFIYFKSLGFSLDRMLLFWVPKILLSVVMWIGVYKGWPNMIGTGLALWTLMLLMETRSEIRSMLQLVSVKLKLAKVRA